jgi:hypothetical protein
MNVEQLFEWESTVETELAGENMPQWHYVHHKSHNNWPGIELRSQWWEAGD